MASRRKKTPRKSTPRKRAAAAGAAKRARRAKRVTKRSTPRRSATPVRRASNATPRPEKLSEIRINVTTLGDLLLTAADRHPDAEALVFPDVRLTYSELASRAMERARALQ